MRFENNRIAGRWISLWLLMFLLTISCSAPPVAASAPDPTPESVLPSSLPTPTPFQPELENTSDPYFSNGSQDTSVVPTFTPYPTKYVLPQDVTVQVDSAPAADSGLTVYNPLTGLPVSDPSLLQRRPLAIKIGNSPDYVRPQSGLSLADVAYEYYIEWGDTRFIAIFYSNNAERVGPVRSGRYFDENIARMYHSYLMFKGADPRELSYLKSTDINPFLIIVGIGNCPPYFIGPYKRDSYNNVFFNMLKWDACLKKKGWDNTPQTISGGFFSEEPPQSPLNVSRIFTFFTVYNYSYWQYDPQNHYYLRYQEAKDLTKVKNETYAQLTDDLTKLPIKAENVVVLFVPYTFANENNAHDEVYNVSLIDYGNAYVFRDGVAIPARWNRIALDQPILLTNLDGTPIYLRPGQTFYEVMGATSKYTQNGADWRFEFQTP